MSDETEAELLARMGRMAESARADRFAKRLAESIGMGIALSIERELLARALTAHPARMTVRCSVFAEAECVMVPNGEPSKDPAPAAAEQVAPSPVPPAAAGTP